MKKEFSESVTGSAIQVVGDHSSKSIEDQLPDVPGGSEQPSLQAPNNRQVLQIDTTSKLSPKSTLVVVSAVVLMIAGMIATYLYNNKPWQQHAALKTAPPAVTVTTALAEKRMMEDDLIVTGSVSAWDPISVGSEVGGLRIKTVNVEEGDRVKKGQVLVTLNSALLQTQL